MHYEKETPEFIIRESLILYVLLTFSISFEQATFLSFCPFSQTQFLCEA